MRLTEFLYRHSYYTLETTIKNAPQGDIHIVSTTKDDIKLIQELPKNKNKSFLFVADSTKEDVLA